MENFWFMKRRCYHKKNSVIMRNCIIIEKLDKYGELLFYGNKPIPTKKLRYYEKKNVVFMEKQRFH